MSVYDHAFVRLRAAPFIAGVPHAPRVDDVRFAHGKIWVDTPDARIRVCVGQHHGVCYELEVFFLLLFIHVVLTRSLMASRGLSPKWVSTIPHFARPQHACLPMAKSGCTRRMLASVWVCRAAPWSGLLPRLLQARGLRLVALPLGCFNPLLGGG